MKLNALEHMQGDLVKLLDESRELIKKNRVNFEDAKLIASYITEMRVLLDTLWEVQVKANMHRFSSEVYKLKEQVMELEGVVKEARNSLEQHGASKSSYKKDL